jgi:hypothetical protein
MATITVEKILTKAPLAGSVQGIIKNAPIAITDEKIQEECSMARYGDKYGKLNRNWEEDLKKVEEIRKRICLK